MKRKSQQRSGEYHASRLDWPADQARTPPTERERAAFRHRGREVSVAMAIDRLMAEIRLWTRVGRNWRMNPDEVVISTNMPRRNDGLPRSGAREPDDPGAAVYFELDGQAYCMACDAWDRVGDNLVAIAKHLEAMRGMERWGVGDSQKNFAGFKQLTGESDGFPTVHDAADFIARFSDGVHAWELFEMDGLEHGYRTAAMKVHPDRGGSEDDMAKLNAAYNRIKASFCFDNTGIGVSL